jgi:hypothetical protein
VPEKAVSRTLAAVSRVPAGQKWYGQEWRVTAVCHLGIMAVITWAAAFFFGWIFLARYWTNISGALLD